MLQLCRQTDPGILTHGRGVGDHGGPVVPAHRVRHEQVVGAVGLEVLCLLPVRVAVEQDVLLHPEGLPDAQVVEQRRLLHLHGEVDDGDVGVVEAVEDVGLAEVEALEDQVLKRLEI